MLTRNDTSLAAPHVRGKLAVVVFVSYSPSLCRRESAHTVCANEPPIPTPILPLVRLQITSHPCWHSPFSSYVVHSTFSLIFPLHLLYLKLTTPYTVSEILKGLSIAVTKHLTPRDAPRPHRFPRFAFVRLVSLLTIGVTYPGLLWFAAISLASVSDVTAIWNTNAFFAYLISVKLLHLKWETRKLFAVVLATLGTVAVVYGGASASEGHEPSHDATGSKVNTYLKPTAPLLGNLLTLVASFGYGLYQVLYKIYAALPTDPEVTSDPLYSPIAQQGDDASADPDFDAESDPLAGSSSPEGKALYPPPFGLHPNLLTSIIGLITLFVLALFIPVLHITGVERFALPGDMKTALSIAGIALGGMVFNAGFMVLLGVWGPIVTSVGNLLTIVLMLISDSIFGSGLESFTLWSLFGSSVIVIAFGYSRTICSPGDVEFTPKVSTTLD
ncbi:hypothetical protein FA13DRAFT_1438554 [Coprinellus micaceus]|uniref:EamA domain-containing protein n=1 Tax=Coprinellus micaceus TaxID=71717 RepID=A0A4Y7TM84_COPMI|nr:hypothetical protein FA13DRAFT_1438554 [Coprinellus micaceus]